MPARLFRCCCLPAGVVVWLAMSIAPPALAGSIGIDSYNSWRWGGFSGSGPATQYWWDSTAPASSGSSSSSVPSNSQAGTEPPPSISLSGYVYLDADKNGLMELSDWTIPDATLALFLDTAPTTPRMSTKTNEDGSYAFIDDGSLPHERTSYRITLESRGYKGGEAFAGTLGGTVEDEYTISGILWPDYSSGTRYDFCQFAYPLDLVSKRLLMGGPPPMHAPEPGSLTLLAVAGLLLGALAAVRHRRRKA